MLTNRRVTRQLVGDPPWWPTVASGYAVKITADGPPRPAIRLLIGQTRSFLKSWRAVKKNQSLKSVPSYFELCSKKKLNTAWISSPLNRCCLRCLSKKSNLMCKDAILRLGKTLGRQSLRSDGVVPTLTDGCTQMLVASSACVLTVDQLLCLCGISPAKHPHVFDMATRNPARS